MTFEFTARDMPQQNHLVELAFAVLANCGRALMVKANVPERMRYQFFREAFQTATLLDGLIATTIDGVTKTRVEHWCGQLPKFVKHLHTWGEAGTVKTRDLSTTKVEDRGVQCMFVGYALHHASDCYRMYNPKTKAILLSRDIIWLQQMFFDGSKRSREPELTELKFHDEVEVIETGESVGDSVNEPTTPPVTQTTPVQPAAAATTTT